MKCKPSKSRIDLPSPRTAGVRCPGAFSLIEVVIALGVVAFAIVAIMGLIPAAVDSAAESKRESRAAFIAQNVFANLEATPFLAARAFDDGNPIDLSVERVGNQSVHMFFDVNGTPLKEAQPSQYIAGAPSEDDAEFLARISVEPQTGSGLNLSKVTVFLETPVAAPEGNRRRYPFVALIGDRS